MESIIYYLCYQAYKGDNMVTFPLKLDKKTHEDLKNISFYKDKTMKETVIQLIKDYNQKNKGILNKFKTRR